MVKCGSYLLHELGIFVFSLHLIVERIEIIMFNHAKVYWPWKIFGLWRHEELTTNVDLLSNKVCPMFLVNLL